MDRVHQTVQDASVQALIEIFSMVQVNCISDDEEPINCKKRKINSSISLQGNAKRRCPNVEVEIVNEQEDSKPKRETIWSFGDCPICLQALEKSSISATKCGHVFCTNCIKAVLLTFKTCPSCRKTVTLKTIFPLYL